MSGQLTPQQQADWNQSKAEQVIISLVVFLVIANSVAALKFLAQYRKGDKFFIEDIFLLIGVACTDAVIVSYIRAVQYGLGYHIFRVTTDDPHKPERMVHFLYWLWLPSVFNGPVFTSLKLALLFLYRRLFMVHRNWFFIAWWANLVYAMLWFVASTLFYILGCIPPSYYWEKVYISEKIAPPHPVSGHCVKTKPSTNAMPLILGVISDIGILALPMVTLAKLQVARRKKIGLLFLFSLGLLAIALELARCVQIDVKSGLKSYGTDIDISYNLISFVIMTCALETLTIVVVCLPVVAPQMMKECKRISSGLSSYNLSSAKALAVVGVKRSSVRRLESEGEDSEETLRFYPGRMTTSITSHKDNLNHSEEQELGAIKVRTDIEVSRQA